MAIRKKSPIKVTPVVDRETAKRVSLDYKNYEELAQFMSDRAKVYGRKRTGFNASQQRKLTAAVKRARHLALLPYKQALS